MRVARSPVLSFSFSPPPGSHPQIVLPHWVRSLALACCFKDWLTEYAAEAFSSPKSFHNRQWPQTPVQGASQIRRAGSPGPIQIKSKAMPACMHAQNDFSGLASLAAP